MLNNVTSKLPDTIFKTYFVSTSLPPPRYDKNETRDYLRFDPGRTSSEKRDEGERRRDQEKRRKEYEGTMRKKPSGEVQGEDPDVLVCVECWKWGRINVPAVVCSFTIS